MKTLIVCLRVCLRVCGQLCLSESAASPCGVLVAGRCCRGDATERMLGGGPRKPGPCSCGHRTRSSGTGDREVRCRLCSDGPGTCQIRAELAALEDAAGKDRMVVDKMDSFLGSVDARLCIGTREFDRGAVATERVVVAERLANWTADLAILTAERDRDLAFHAKWLDAIRSDLLEWAEAKRGQRERALALRCNDLGEPSCSQALRRVRDGQEKFFEEQQVAAEATALFAQLTGKTHTPIAVAVAKSPLLETEAEVLSDSSGTPIADLITETVVSSKKVTTVTRKNPLCK